MIAFRHHGGPIFAPLSEFACYITADFHQHGKSRDPHFLYDGSGWIQPRRRAVVYGPNCIARSWPLLNARETLGRQPVLKRDRGFDASPVIQKHFPGARHLPGARLLESLPTHLFGSRLPPRPAQKGL